VHGAVLDRSELGDVPTHVVAVGVEALTLHRRVEHAVRVGVGAGARDPLPVEVVLREVAVDEQVEEVLGADAPVDVQVPW